MSRTDVHAPYRVKARDPGWRDHFTEHHNHAQRVTGATREPGPPPRWVHRYEIVVRCDLADFLAGVEDTACSMGYVGRRRNIFCGCRLCTGADGRRLARRQERVRWRSARAALLAALPAERGDVDVPPIRGKAW